jgi:hypothetical protein
MFHRPFSTAPAALCAAGLLLLSACGGGGDANDGQAPPVEAARVSISAANAPRVTAEALQAAQASGFASGSLEGGGSADIEANQVLGSTLARVLKPARTAGRVAPLATKVTTELCSGGGNVTTTITTNGAEQQPGDSIGVTFDDCTERGIVFDGSLQMVVSALNETTISFTATTTDLQATVGNVAERSSGSLTLSLNFGDLDQVSFSATSDLFTVERSVGGVLRSSRSLRGLDLQQGISLVDGTVSISADFTASGLFPDLGEASFQVVTVAPLVIPPDEVHPTSGQVKVTGGNGSSITIIVGADSVQLQVDANGDGTVDQEIVRSWDQVLADL